MEDGAVRLTSTDGTVVELQPLRYQFPAAAGAGPQDWDANWLVIRGDVHLPDGRRWHFQDPCLTTWEAAELAGWLRSVAAGEVEAHPLPPDEDRLLAFTEPNLGFSLGSTGEGASQIRVHFSLEAAPPWSRPPEADAELYDFFVIVSTTVADLTRAVDEWDGERAAFPPR